MSAKITERERAENYGEIASSWQYGEGKILADKLDLQPGQKVLDIGCGTGELSAYIASKVGENGKVVAIDPDKERVAVAKEKFKDVHNLKFFVAGISEIPGNDLFDAIFSSSVFHWIPEKELESALRRINEYRLKHGGIVAVEVTSECPSIEAAVKCLPNESQENIWSTHIMRSGLQYETIFKNAGFTKIDWEIHESTTTFKSKEDFFYAVCVSTKGLIDISKASKEKLDDIEWKLAPCGDFLVEELMVMIFARK